MISTDFHGNLRGACFPCSIVRVDGNEIVFNSWTVNLNSTHVADDFSVLLPFRITTDESRQTYLNNTPEFTSYFFTTSDILVEIFVGFSVDGTYDINNMTQLMYGYMDEANAGGSSAGETVTIRGRNMVAPFLDNKTTDKYQNMTFSAIAEMLAKKHGMEAEVTPTYTLAGAYENGDSVQLSSDITEWDLLTFGAQAEGFALRVVGNKLYFGPFESIVGNLTNDFLPYTWGQNIISWTLDRQPHAAKNLVIEVHSHDKKSGKHIKGVAKRGYAKATSSYTERFYYAGLTQDQAQKKAQSILDQLSRLEITGTLNVTGNEKLTVDRKIALYGLGMGLSDFYYIRQATHSYDQSGGAGYTCSLTFSNLLLPDEQEGAL